MESSAFPSAIPVQFSPQLLHALDASTETSVTRSEHKSQEIAKQVSAKLDSILSSKVMELDDTIEKSLLKTDNGVGAPSLNEKLDVVYSKLKSSAEAKIAKSDSLKAAEESVANCLLKNKGRPLNCWDEVQEFKKLAGVP